MKKERFKEIYGQGFGQTMRILVDLETGVNYLMCTCGYAGGLTPLLDENGNVVISKKESE